MIDRERLAAELAQAHGLRVDPDDPVLITALLNRRLLDEALIALDAAVRTAANQMSAGAAQQVEAARKTAAGLITDAGQWSADHLRATAVELSASIQKDLRAEVARAEAAARLAMRIAWLLGGITAVALAGFGGFWLAGL